MKVSSSGLGEQKTVNMLQEPGTVGMSTCKWIFKMFVQTSGHIYSSLR